MLWKVDLLKLTRYYRKLFVHLKTHVHLYLYEKVWRPVAIDSIGMKNKDRVEAEINRDKTETSGVEEPIREINLEVPLRSLTISSDDITSITKIYHQC